MRCFTAKRSPRHGDLVRTPWNVIVKTGFTGILRLRSARFAASLRSGRQSYGFHMGLKSNALPHPTGVCI
jgi:hypothetical protein